MTVLFLSTGYNYKYEHHHKYLKLHIYRNVVLFPWSSPSWRSRKRSAENDFQVFQAWHWVFTHLKLWAFKYVYISRGSLQKSVYFSKETHMKQIFYFPIKIMVPISMIFGKTKKYCWMMPLMCSMLLKSCCFLLWKCLIFSA